MLSGAAQVMLRCLLPGRPPALLVAAAAAAYGTYFKSRRVSRCRSWYQLLGQLIFRMWGRCPRLLSSLVFSNPGWHLPMDGALQDDDVFRGFRSSEREAAFRADFHRTSLASDRRILAGTNLINLPMAIKVLAARGWPGMALTLAHNAYALLLLLLLRRRPALYFHQRSLLVMISTPVQFTVRHGHHALCLPACLPERCLLACALSPAPTPASVANDAPTCPVPHPCLPACSSLACRRPLR